MEFPHYSFIMMIVIGIVSSMTDTKKTRVMIMTIAIELNSFTKEKKDWEVKNSDQIIMYIIFTFVVAVVAIWVVYDKFFDMDFAFVVVVI